MLKIKYSVLRTEVWRIPKSIANTTMCGIFCEIYCRSCKSKEEKIIQRIKNRGPDCSLKVCFEVDSNKNILFYGAVLWMQGPAPISQPVENDYRVLLFNGDIYNKSWNTDISDTQLLFNKLGDADTELQVISVLQSLKGPFSIVYFDKLEKSLYFCRDKIGRTSLLCYKHENSFILASVLDRKHKCIEVPATHIYKLNISSNTLRLYSWVSSETTEELGINEWINIVQRQQNMPDVEPAFELGTNSEIICEDDIVNFIENKALNHSCKLTIMQELLKNDIILKTVKKITELLEKSVKIRLEKQPQKCKRCIKDTMSICNHSTIGVLFSGGLDCTVLAFLADKYVPQNQPIDLINVAFKMADNASYDVPDRITGRQSLNELTEKCKSRKWIFREINVPKEKLQEYQESTIGDLVYPRYTILDESLGSALWFAASGEDGNDISPCRVLLLGSGADELFGGYVRHRNAFKRLGWTGLNNELVLDWKRISYRNLARDNRVICDHGRQPRMPYLDEEFSDYVFKLKPWMKCFPSENLPCGIGDKLMLRLVALNLGLTEAVILPKRALQFGSRIAKKKEKGSDTSKTFSTIKK